MLIGFGLGEKDRGNVIVAVLGLIYNIRLNYRSKILSRLTCLLC